MSEQEKHNNLAQIIIYGKGRWYGEMRTHTHSI